MTVSMITMTYFIPQAQMKHCVSETNAVKTYVQDLDTNEGDWTGKVQIRTGKKFLAVGEACVAIF